MALRKNISLDEEHLKKLEPMLKTHNGNLSAVVREIIDLTDIAFKDPDSLKKIISGLKSKQNLTSATLDWTLKNLSGRLPPDGTVYNIIGNDVTSVASLEKRLNELMGEVYWDSSIKINADDEWHPKNASFVITGKNQDMDRFLAAIAAVFASKKYALGVLDARSANNSFEMHMRSGETDWINKSIQDTFGYMDRSFSELYANPDFWNAMLDLHAKMNYKLVTIPRQLFEEILSGKPSNKLVTIIERYCGCPINQIQLPELLEKIKGIYQYAGIIENIDINKDSLVVHHTFGEPEAIKKLANMLVELLSLGGHAYSSVASKNLIVLKPIPRAGRILIKMIDEIKTGGDYTISYHANLLKTLDMLKNMPANEEFVKSLGCKFGKNMISAYEKDKNIKTWDGESFVRYLQDAGAILKQDLKCELIGENVIHGKIFTCPLVKCDGRFDTLNCIVIKGMLEGAIMHAFGEQVEIIYATPQPSADGSDFCEIYVTWKS